ncbi:MAG: hypothetical protein RL154_820 [Pseudomonadota bacterium]|jgi:tRNA(fMet)-specific endonuclease VapC
MSYLVDTNAIIAFLKGYTKVSQKLSSQKELFASCISVGEMRYGANNSLQKDKNITLYDSFFETCNILSIDSKVATSYGELRFYLKTIGRSIPENDIWIAATAKVFSLSILTFDKDFSYFGDKVRVEIL